MLSWFMSDSVTVDSAKENEGAPLPHPSGIGSTPAPEPSPAADKVLADVDGTPGVHGTPDRTEEEKAASPVLRRSARTKRKLNNSIDGVSDAVAVRKVVRRQRMSSVRRTPVKGPAPKVLPPTLVLGANATPGPTSFPFPPVVPETPLPVAAIATNPDAPLTEGRLAAMLLGMEGRLGVKIDSVDCKVATNTASINENTVTIKHTADTVKRLEERVENNEAQLDDRIIKVVEAMNGPVSYTHLTLPTIYSV